MLDHSTDSYFVDLPWFVRGQFLKLDHTAHHCGTGKASLYSLEDCVAEQLDHLYYLNDILKIEMISEALHEKICTILLYPLLVKSILEPEVDVGIDETESTVMDVETNCSEEHNLCSHKSGALSVDNVASVRNGQDDEHIVYSEDTNTATTHASSASSIKNDQMESNETELSSSSSIEPVPLQVANSPRSDTLSLISSTSEDGNIVEGHYENSCPNRSQLSTPPASPSSHSQTPKERKGAHAKYLRRQQTTQRSNPKRSRINDDDSNGQHDETTRLKTIDELRIPVDRVCSAFALNVHKWGCPLTTDTVLTNAKANETPFSQHSLVLIVTSIPCIRSQGAASRIGTHSDLARQI